MSITGIIESLLLVAAKPLDFAVLAKNIGVTEEQIRTAVTELEERYNTKESGIQLLVNGDRIQLMTNPEYRAVIAAFIKDETTGELTKPSLETLTIIAYRQPVTKEALEQIRGVNCSLIIRNLLIRGLIESHEERGGLATTYVVTNDFLRYLGIHKVDELPDYTTLHRNERLDAVVQQPASTVTV